MTPAPTEAFARTVAPHLPDDSTPTASKVEDTPIPTPTEPPPSSATPIAASPEPAPPALQAIGQIGGASKAVVVKGAYAYLNVGPRLVVLDVSDLLHPHVIGRSSPFPGFESLDVSEYPSFGSQDVHAYIAAGKGGLRVIDISDPAAPNEVGVFVAEEPVLDVLVLENLAYLAAGDGLHVLDISNPREPTKVGFYETSNSLLDVLVVGNTAYAAEEFSEDDNSPDSGGLRILDISNPTNPSEIGFYSMNPSQADEFERPLAPRGVRRVAVVGSYAYLTYPTWRQGGLRVVDVSDPANPTEVGDYRDYVYYISDVTMVKTPATVTERILAYVATGPNFGLLVLDVTDPEQITVLADQVPGAAQGMARVGNTLFIADQWGGLHIADISEPTRAKEIGSFNTLGDARDVTLHRNIAYVTDGLRDLWVVDVSNPEQPVQVGVYSAPGTIQDVAADGTTVYIAAETAGLLVLDLSDPADPAKVGFFETPGLSYAVAAHGDYAYVVDGQLHVLNVSDPTSPTPVAHLECPERIEDVIVAESIAYYVCDGLHILDVSDPPHPVEIGYHAAPGRIQAVAVVGGFANFLTAGTLHIVDLSNPQQPRQVARFAFEDVPAYEGHMAIAQEYAYVVGESCVHVVGLSAPAGKNETHYCDMPKRVNGIATAGEYVFVAAGVDGLIVLQLTSGG